MSKTKRRTLLLCAGLAILVSLAVIAFFVWGLQLRTGYRAMCLEINDAVLATPPDKAIISRDGGEWPADESMVDYLNQFLLRVKTPFSRRETPENEQSIVLSLQGGRLSYTELPNDAIAIRWETPEDTKSYTVRSSTAFRRLSAYVNSYLKQFA